jgi:hypothetical protein
MFGWMRAKDESDNRLLEIMKNNRNRVTVSADGVVRLNLNNKDVRKKISDDIEILKQLKEI